MTRPRPRLRLITNDETPRDQLFNPLFDPARDGWPEQSLTAQICGDPIPGRRELVASMPLGSVYTSDERLPAGTRIVDDWTFI